jgi:hypothetical protein
MPRLNSALHGLLVTTGLVACGGEGRSRRAEQVPAEPLPLATDTLITPYGEVPEGAWLGGRRWLVVAGDFDAAVIADFTTRSVAPLGGSPNAELAKPYAAFVVQDTVFLADWGKSRLSIWTPDGTMLGAIPAPGATRGILPRARDAAGQLYFEVPPLPGPDGSGNRDSISIVRADPGLTRFDTVAKLAPLDVAEMQLPGGRRYERLLLSGKDEWGVRPDGRLWIARVNANRVNTIVERKETRGEALPDPVLEVKRSDRDAFIQSFPEEVRSTVDNLLFAPFKPPFERGFAAPDGLVWLRKTRAAGDSIRRYHVVDTSGMLARVLTTVGNGVLIAASRETVLLAEQFREGVRLMELRVPSPAGGR